MGNACTPIPPAIWKECKLKCKLVDFLRKNERIRKTVTKVNACILDIEAKVAYLRFHDRTKKSAAILDDEELFALVTYTYENGDDPRPGLFYHEQNLDLLKLRDPEKKPLVMETWGPLTFRLLFAMSKLPNIATVAYRCVPNFF